MASYLDPTYEAQRAQATKRRSDALAGVTQDKQSMEQEYGFADTSNPYSRINELNASFERLRRFTSAQMGASGYGYDGSYTATQDHNAGGYLRDRDGLQRAYNAAKSGLRTRELGIENEYTDTTNDISYKEARDRADAAATGEDQYLTPDPAPAPTSAVSQTPNSRTFKPLVGGSVAKRYRSFPQQNSNQITKRKTRKAWKR